MTIVDIMLRLKEFKVTDVKDKIYATLGLSKILDSQIVPDSHLHLR